MSEDHQGITLTRKIVHFLAKDDLTCQVIFVTKMKLDEELDVTLQYMDMTDKSIKEIISNCQKFVNDRDQWEAEQYGKNRDDDLVRKYNTEDLEKIPNRNKYLKKAHIKAESLGDPDLVKHLKFIQFRFESKNKAVIFVKKFTMQRILSHGKKLWKEISGTLTLNDDRVVEMPTDFDFCIYPNDALIFQPDNFEEFFDYQEIHAKYHERVFNHLMKNVDYTIDNVDVFRDMSFNDPRKLRKLPAIEEKQMYLWTFNRIQGFLKKRPIASVTLDVKNKVIKFKNVYSMLDFFNDAHLTSQATETNYLARAKSKE